MPRRFTIPTPEIDPRWEIRTAEKADKSALSIVFDAAFAPLVGPLGYRPSPLDRTFAAALENRLALAAHPAGSAVPIGFAALSAAPSQLYVDAIGILPEAQGQGAGLALLAGVERLASELCLERVRLDTDPRLEAQMRFYQRAGYRVIRRFAAGEADRVRFSKTVATALDKLLGARLGQSDG